MVAGVVPAERALVRKMAPIVGRTGDQSPTTMVLAIGNPRLANADRDWFLEFGLTELPKVAQRRSSTVHLQRSLCDTLAGSSRRKAQTRSSLHFLSAESGIACPRPSHAARIAACVDDLPCGPRRA